MKNIKNIIFDWDNTLFPFKKYWFIANRRVFLDLLDFEQDFSIDDVMDKFVYFDTLMWTDVYAEKITVQEARENRVRLTLDYFEISYEETFIDNFWDIFLQDLMKEIKQENQLVEKMKQLSKRYSIAILSNGESWEQREKIRRFGFEDLFPVYISGETGWTKPDYRAFQNILEQENFQAEETLMVGDLIGHDILPAKQLGMVTVYIGSEKDTIADYEFSNLQDFLENLE
ncbi:HAD family hydrolase [Lactococcus nasutitermitis]|uniref:HAD family hydrolase n=1 Tax=Lactococcus nasutitermitis TaxID=1652957 RepID=A0ABV9JBT4_9LACT|nr:HAD family hydrolase [Lactococcus nasutitermitis]